MPSKHPRDLCKCGKSKLVQSQTCAACRPNLGLKKPLYDACQNTLKDGETCSNEKSVKAKQCMECYAEKRRKRNGPEEDRRSPHYAHLEKLNNHYLSMPLHARSQA